MEWTKYPFVKFALYFFLGIYIANTIDLNNSGVIILLFGSITFYLVLHYSPWNEITKIKVKSLKGFLTLPILLCFGILNFHASSPIKQKNHISNFTFSEYAAIIESKPEITRGKKKFVARVSSVYQKTWKPSTGKVLCYIDSAVTVKRNDTIFIYGLPLEQERPLNPEEFNYKNFLLNKGISHIHFLKSNQIIIRKGKTNKIYQLAYFCADWLRGIVSEYIPGNSEKALTLGLILGDKQLLTTEVKEKFSETGLVHILAVSGFHVALIYQVIIMFTGFLKGMPGSKTLIFILSLLSLWLYAIMTGISPSVIRATTMFSIVLVSKAINRRAHGMHNLALAAFIIMLFDPQTAFDVGFQLSIMAVAGILIFFNPLKNLLEPKNFILQKAWETLCISTAAQIFTLPLVLYMFKDFPVYFLLSNLVASVPVLIIIYSTLLLPLFSALPIIATFIGKFIAFNCQTLSYMVDLINNLPDPLHNSLTLNLLQVILLFSAIILALYGLYVKKLYILKLSFALTFIFIAYISITKYNLYNQRLFIAFHLRNHSAVSFIKGQQAVIVSDEALNPKHKLYTFHIEPFLQSRLIKSITFIQNKDDFIFKEKEYCMVVNNKSCDLNELSTANFLVIKNPDSLPFDENIIKPNRLIILDGSLSNYKRKNIKFPAYKTWEQGAFIANLNE